MDVTRLEQLDSAIAAATYDDIDPVIQRQVEGQEVRLTVMKGRVESVILRQNALLVGDGHSSVRELFEEENRIRSKLVFPTLQYPQLDANLLLQLEVDQTYVPAPKDTIRLNRASMIRDGSSFIGITDYIHDGYKDIAETLASKLATPFICVDLIVKDVAIAPTLTNYVFLEFNTSPSLKTYTSLRSGDTPDIVRRIADMIDSYAAMFGQ